MNVEIANPIKVMMSVKDGKNYKIKYSGNTVTCQILLCNI
jgi:hypothetical protein